MKCVERRGQIVNSEFIRLWSLERGEKKKNAEKTLSDVCDRVGIYLSKVD